MSKTCQRNLVIAVSIATIFGLAVIYTLKDIDRAVRGMIQ